MDVLDLSASITLNLDNFESNLAKAQKKFSAFGDNISGLSSNIDKVYSGVKDVLSPVADGFKFVESVGGKAANAVTTGFKLLSGAATVAAGGATMVGKSAFDAYANYEQLVGGVETLFKDSADEVMGYASNAYKTAGMSANQYMDLTTSFVASLLQSLDGDTSAAAKMADLAATDMADNWNKMGSTMQSVQDAYRGFAKQNYTMLDNLKLGYGGTKAEMERLLADAEKFSGIKYDLSSYADIISAIHVIQTEMGITGTTALEASTTIQGSIQSAKGAWENFMVGIADSNQNMGRLMDNLIESVVTAGNNVVPRIKEIVNQAVRIGPELLRGFSAVIPEFARMGGEIVQTLTNGLIAQAPAMLDFGSKAVGWIANGIVKGVPKAANGITSLITGIGHMVGENMEALLHAGQTILSGILRVFNSASYQISKYIGDFVPLIANAFIQQHEALFRVGINILGAIGQGLVENKEKIGGIASEAIASMVSAFRSNAPHIIEGGIALLEALVGAIEENIPRILAAGAEIVAQLVAGISTASPAVQAIIGATVLPHILKIIEVVGNIGGAVKSMIGIVQPLISGIVKFISSGITTILGVGSKLMTGIKALFALLMAHPVIAIITAIIAAVVLLWNNCEAFRDAVKAIWDAIVGFFEAAAESIKAAFDGVVDFFASIWQGIQDIFSVVADVLGGFFRTAWDVIQSAWSAAVEFFAGIWQGIQDVFSTVGEVLGNIFRVALEIIKAEWSSAVEFFSGIWEGIKAVFSAVAEVLGGFFKDAWAAIKEVWETAKDFFSGVGEGIREVFSEVTEFLGSAFKAAWDVVKGAWEAAKEFFSGVWASIKEKGEAAASGVGEALKGAWEKAKTAWNNASSFFSGVKEKITSVFKNLVNSAKTWGRDMLSNFVSGISEKVGAVVSKVKSVAQTVRDYIGFSEPKKGPLSNFHAYAPDMMQLFADGIAQSAGLVQRQLDRSLNFDFETRPLSFASNGISAGNAQNSARYEQPVSRGGDTFNFYSPKALDPVSAAREMRKAKQQMALGYV